MNEFKRYNLLGDHCNLFLEKTALTAVPVCRPGMLVRESEWLAIG